MTQPTTKRLVSEARLNDAVAAAVAAPTGTAIDNYIGSGASVAVRKVDFSAAASDRAVTAGGKAINSAVNVRQGYAANQIASDVYGTVILGGGQSGFNNIIGGASAADKASIGTSAHADKTALNGSNANYAVVGGYDNWAGALASLLIAFHCWTDPAATHATIAGGSMHSITGGDYGAIVGGTANTLGSTSAAIVGGQQNTIDGSSAGASILSTIQGSVTSSTGATLLGGQQLTATSASYGVASGLRAALRHYGARVHGSGYFATVGDAQAGDYLLRRSGTSGTLALDGSGALLALQDNQTIAAVILVAATAVGGGTAAAWKIDIAAARSTGAATTRLLGTPLVTTLGKDSGATSWAPTVTANTAGDLRITFVGDGATTIRIQSRVMTCEVIG